MNSCTSLSFAKATNTLKEIQDQMNILTECGISTESFVGNSERTMKDFEAILSNARCFLEIKIEALAIQFSDSGMSNEEISSKLDMQVRQVTEIVDAEQMKRQQKSEYESAKNAVPAELAKLTISEVGFSSRLRHLLQGEGCSCILDVAMMTQNQVSKIQGMGKILRNELMTFMSSNNLQFRPVSSIVYF